VARRPGYRNWESALRQPYQRELRLLAAAPAKSAIRQTLHKRPVRHNVSELAAQGLSAKLAQTLRTTRAPLDAAVLVRALRPRLSLISDAVGLLDAISESNTRGASQALDPKAERASYPREVAQTDLAEKNLVTNQRDAPARLAVVDKCTTHEPRGYQLPCGRRGITEELRGLGPTRAIVRRRWSSNQCLPNRRGKGWQRTSLVRSIVPIPADHEYRDLTPQIFSIRRIPRILQPLPHLLATRLGGCRDGFLN
jgi:hypothetical protein